MSYRLQNDGMRYWTGRTGDGTQYLVGPSLPRLLIYKFNPQGRLLERQQTDVIPPPTWDSANGVYRTDSAFIATMEGQVAALLRRIEIHTAAIEIAAFFDEEEEIGIVDLPEPFREYLGHPSDYALEDRRSLEAALLEWRAQNRFVLVWGDEHWMSEDGVMLST